MTIGFYRRAAMNVAALGPVPVPDGAIALLAVADLHGNVGMASVMRAAAQVVGAAVVLDAGDLTVNGLAVERAVVRRLAAKGDPPRALVLGNHDSERTGRQALAAGAIVLDGSVREIAGIRILGDADPRWFSLGRLRLKERHGRISPETGLAAVHEQGDRLTAVACAERGAGRRVDLLLVHDPRAAVAALEAGSVPLAICGHMHTRRGPEAVGSGLRLTLSSTGRDVRGSTLFGRLRAPSELEVCYLDAATGALRGWRTLTVRPDGNAAISPLRA